MTPQEFKAWFDGFTEAFAGTPTKAQWARVKERVAEIDGKPTTERIFVDRYWPSYYPVYPQYPSYFRTGLGGASIVTSNASMVGQNGDAGHNALASLFATSPHPEGWSSTIAMSDLGRADAKALQ